MSIARYLQDVRLQKNLTVEEVATKANISVGSVRAYEQDRRKPSAKSLIGLLSALDVESHWIDNVTWQNPLDDTIHDLAPIGGGWPKNRKTSDYTKRDPSVSIAKIRLEAIDAILKADTSSVKAVITLLKR
jgi:transcriptional regulator with XRE-family HTH domain